MKALCPITVLAALLGLFTSACDRNPQGLASGRGSDLSFNRALRRSSERWLAESPSTASATATAISTS